MNTIDPAVIAPSFFLCFFLFIPVNVSAGGATAGRRKSLIVWVKHKSADEPFILDWIQAEEAGGENTISHES